MEQRKHKWREPAPAAQVDQLLASRYSQLLQWGAVLTRGDTGKTEEIVQELCLYFTLTKPDLSGVANLDGYLYTALRHIYLSSLARSSREALHFVSIAEFDSFASALDDSPSGDPLQRQNDLRRICGYSVWRKESSKTASYFLLHFFHGYGRREIAELARLPIAAIYNKLKIARSEVRSYLEDSGKLRLVSRNLPPEPVLSWKQVSSAELFRELRQTILQARLSDCLSEEDLLAHYRRSRPQPISCFLLAHIVSCERCLAIVDRHFLRPTLRDREPLDGFGSGPDDGNDSVAGPSSVGPSGVSQKQMLQAVRKRWGRVHEHRPRTLSIAVNGQIVAFHDVQAEYSKLSARIEHLESARFVEVFSEQDVRLALLSIGELPPEGSQVRTQRVELSDERWLELNLTFDGMGLHSQVSYYDPALGMMAADEDQDTPPAWAVRPGADHMSGILLWPREVYAAFRRILHAMMPSSAIAWALTLAILFGTAAYLAYRHTTAPMDAQEILNESVKTEAASLQGQTEHQILHIEEASANGRVLQQGVVDLWKDGDGGRYLRRLYDSQHRMIAAEWRNKNGEHNPRRKEPSRSTPGHPLLMNEFWDQDLSAQAFLSLGVKAPQVHVLKDGYELTTAGPIEGHPQLVSAVLVLDRHLLPIRSTLRVRSGTGVHELRFVQAGYERIPRTSVPDTTFDPGYSSAERDPRLPLIHPHGLPIEAAGDLSLAELQIAVLYQLNRLGADTGEPIEVIRTEDAHIRVSGAIANDALKQKIVAQLQALPTHQLLDVKLVSPHGAQLHAGRPQLIPGGANVYEINQAKSAADATLRKYFEARGLSGEPLNSAAGQFSHDALDHAQRSLQHAYALDRLGVALSAAELQSIHSASLQQWTEMVDTHAFVLEDQLRALHGQLEEVLGEESQEAVGEPIQINDPAQFKQATDHLLRLTQDLERDVGGAFTSNAAADTQSGQAAQLPNIVRIIPLREAEEVARFATRLHASTTLVNGKNREPLQLDGSDR
jgi:DNA-directed RNA polymerase specialized sigma24 family protein